ncbi:hypothetical protein VTG60DRAFT_5785 [Thermothelomyces hinnuleus]
MAQVPDQGPQLPHHHHHHPPPLLVYRGVPVVGQFDDIVGNRAEFLPDLKVLVLGIAGSDVGKGLVHHRGHTPNFAGWVGSLLSSRPADDPVIFDPGYEPYNRLGLEIPRWELGEMSLNYLWDCTFHRHFGDAIKASKTATGVSAAAEMQIMAEGGEAAG